MDEYLRTHIRHVRDTSPFYRDLYAHLPDNVGLSDLPIVDHSQYWAASNADRRSVMTGPQIDGVVMRTGGTTSRPKTTSYSQIELSRTTKLLASGLLAAGIRPGERIANMFYAGDLYASFLLHVLSIIELPVPAVHVPIGGLTAIPEAVDLIKQCEVTALLTTATSLVKLAAYVIEKGEKVERVRCVMYGGEPLFEEQERIIRKAFPCATVRSCIYGSVDSGVLAEAAEGEDHRVHRVFTESVIVEIVAEDGSGKVIQENGEPGLLVATNLARTLNPVIRYPTGDRAVWVDKAAGTFKLLGRAGQGVRLGPVSIDVADLRNVVSTALPDTNIEGVQAIVTRKHDLDQLELAIAARPVNQEVAANGVIETLFQQRPMCKQHVDLALIARPIARFVDFSELKLAQGSGKMIDVVDRRFEIEARRDSPMQEESLQK